MGRHELGPLGPEDGFEPDRQERNMRFVRDWFRELVRANLARRGLPEVPAEPEENLAGEVEIVTGDAQVKVEVEVEDGE